MQVWGIGSSQRLQDDLCAKTNKDKVKTGNRKQETTWFKGQDLKVELVENCKSHISGQDETEVASKQQLF